jgi:hypothetical protein
MAVGGNDFCPVDKSTIISRKEEAKNRIRKQNLRLVVNTINNLLIAHCSDEDVAEFIRIKMLAEGMSIDKLQALKIAHDRPVVAELLKNAPIHRYLDEIEQVGNHDKESMTPQTALSPIVQKVIEQIKSQYRESILQKIFRVFKFMAVILSLPYLFASSSSYPINQPKPQNSSGYTDIIPPRDDYKSFALPTTTENQPVPLSPAGQEQLELENAKITWRMIMSGTDTPAVNEPLTVTNSTPIIPNQNKSEPTTTPVPTTTPPPPTPTKPPPPPASSAAPRGP